MLQTAGRDVDDLDDRAEATEFVDSRRHPPTAVVPPLVLVVEDDADIRFLITFILERKGCRVLQAANATEALAACDPNELDLALIDVGLPGMDGLGLLCAINDRLVDQYVPIVLVTARALADDVAVGLGLGATDYLRKPFETPELLARVDAALKIKRLQDQLRASNRELARLSRTDPLTGTSNRRQLDDDLAELCRASRRAGDTAGALMIDIDHFKQVNDSLGHQRGDQFLRAVAHRLRAALRSTDILGRWGGDEFLVLVADTDLDGALALAERLRAAVADAPVVLAGTPPVSVEATISIGVAAIRGPQAEALVAAADRHLYQAKAAGRARVAGH